VGSLGKAVLLLLLVVLLRCVPREGLARAEAKGVGKAVGVLRGLASRAEAKGMGKAVEEVALLLLFALMVTTAAGGGVGGAAT